MRPLGASFCAVYMPFMLLARLALLIPTHGPRCGYCFVYAVCAVYAVYAVYAVSSLDTSLPLRHRTGQRRRDKLFTLAPRRRDRIDMYAEARGSCRRWRCHRLPNRRH